MGLILMSAWLGAADAGGLAVTPIRIALSDATPTAALRLVNHGGDATLVQLQMMRWSADDGAERYRPTYEIVATPPIATLAPGETQIVRVGLSRNVDPERELAYRLYIEEVPPPARPNHQGLRVALRIGVPIFVSPATPGQPRLEWRARPSGRDRVLLHAENIGDVHLRLMSLALRQAGADRPFAERDIIGYLLPGQSRQWELRVKGGLPQGRWRLSVSANPDVADVDLEPDAP